MTSEELRSGSLLTWCFERFFAGLQCLSIARWYIDARSAVKYPNELPDARRARSQKRGRRIEIYFTSWILAEVAAGLVVVTYPRWGTVAVVACLYRVFDICQSAVNINIFDRLRSPGNPFVLSLARSLLMSCINFCEIMFCFGTLYAFNSTLLAGGKMWYDGYYFSVITQMTIGYGDLSPTGYLRVFAATQSLVGFFFGLVVLGRFISFLPKFDTVLGD